jgi:isopropylmalate/homocitrate/citramalate synthase
MTGMVVQRNKAIVGANAFAHESGIHQDGMLKERSTYEIMRPEDVGLSGSDLVLGKHSGRHALFTHLGRIGVRHQGVPERGYLNRFKELADKKKYIYDDDLIAIMREGLTRGAAGLHAGVHARHHRHQHGADGDRAPAQGRNGNAGFRLRRRSGGRN